MAGTGVGKFSSTASNNTSNLTVNFAENMAPSNVNNAARELMGHMRDMYEQLGDGYFEFGDGDGTYTVARGDADTITITSSSDISGIYFAGRKIRITDGGANVVEGTIASSSHSSTTQTVNLTGISLASGTPTKVELGIDTAAFGGRVILDDDGDTYIEAVTDDTIDIYVAGAKDFVITANTFTAESGSTIAAQALTATTVNASGVLTGTTAVFSSTSADDNFVITSTDADASDPAPDLVLYRNSSSPANGDDIGRIEFRARNNNSQDIVPVLFNAFTAVVTDGSETGNFSISTLIGGTARNRMGFDTTETTFNEGGIDLDFRVESNSNANMLFVDGGNDRLFIGEGNGTTTGQGNRVQIYGTNSQKAGMQIGIGIAGQEASHLEFYKSRNATQGSYTAAAENDKIGRIIFRADDGVDLNSPAGSIECAIDAGVAENDMPGRLMFFTTPDGSASLTERLRIHNNGVASFNNGIALGVGTANTASNVLDDYEEGTYTPTMTVASGSLTVHGSHNTLAYTKIGRVVHVQGEIRFSAVSSPSGNFSMSMPFAVADLAEGAARFTSSPIGQSGFGGTPDGTIFNKNTSEGTTTLGFQTSVTGSGNDATVNANQVSTSTEFIFSFTFIAA